MRPPRIAFTEAPVATENNLVGFTLRVEDDYGVTALNARLTLAPEQPRPLDAPRLSEEALKQTLAVALAPPPGNGAYGLEEDWTDHPWAGLDVEIIIEARDAAGQAGETAPARLTLPARPFYYPLAKSVVEQRQTMAVAPGERGRVVQSFAALTAAPDAFYDETAEYLLMRTAYWRAAAALEAEGFAHLQEEFWDLALKLEDGDLSLARRALKEAIEALRAALEANAPLAEIQEKVAAAREAMERYLSALANSGMTPEEGMQAGDDALDMGDLNDMLSAVEELSEVGSRAAAERLLSELEKLLENLRLASGGGGGGDGPEGQNGEGGEAGPAGEALSELGDLIGDQRRLMDDSFERGRTAPGQAAGDLAADQRALREALDGAGEAPGAPGGAARDEAIDGAGEAMDEAADRLAAGDIDGAIEAQGRAISALREGAEAIAEEAERQMAGENGEDGDGGEGPGGDGENGFDPAGRPIGGADDLGDEVDVPDAFDIERARAILEDLRRRAGDRTLTEDERAYIERLLQRF